MQTTRTLADLAGEDIIDSRDLIEAATNIDTDDEQEVALAAEVDELGEAGIADWAYGETLILDTYFEEYAQQLAEDIGAITGDESWPANCIDWERASRELQMDYSSVSFGGYDYWVRA